MGFPLVYMGSWGYQSNPLDILRLIFVHFGASGSLCVTQLMAGGWLSTKKIIKLPEGTGILLPALLALVVHQSTALFINHKF